VRLWVGHGSSDLKGPLVLYWHGTASNPREANIGLGLSAIAEIKNQGGLVAAPRGPTGLTGNQTGGVVWTSGDYALADEIVACAVQQVGIDTRRIHSMGMSAGGLHTSLLTYRRSGYLASVTTFSGGLVPILPPPPSQDPANKLPAVIFHGGEEDVFNNFNFKTASEKYLNNLRSKGHFAFICNSGLGHVIPPNGGSVAWRFFQDHPWGTAPSPYEKGLPASFPSTCSL
jgi:poly(3-hydroxybutyrate) depolymerase